MKLSKFKYLVKESITKTPNNMLSEGIIDSVISYIVDKLVKKKTKKYFNALAKDPEFIEAKLRVRQALEDFEQNAAKYKKEEESYENLKNDFIKKYGEKKAAALFNNDKYIYGFRYRNPSWKVVK